MAISERVSRLRQQSLEAKASITTERAELMTQYYQLQRGLVSTPVFRAQAFRYLLENETIAIGAGELIVGEK
ncbi:MAG TPA: pyruvate formate lyase family protein, partial [Armatimonadota bacterium]